MSGMFTRRSFFASAAALPFAGAWRANARASATRVARVFVAGPPAAVLVHVLAPEALLGWPSRLEPEALEWIGLPGAGLPVLGRLAGRGTTVPLETLLQLKPDLVLDVGTVDATHASAVARVREQTGLRVELLEGRLADSPRLLREAATALGVPERGLRLAREVERMLAEVARVRASGGAVRVYIARGLDGLETALGGSINAEVLEVAGALNVAAAAGRGGISRVSLEQVLAWDPEVVVTQDRALAGRIASDPLWRSMSAVRDRRVLCAPSLPFGWLDTPPGVNRLLGVLWLARSLAPGAASGLRDEVRSFYSSFYRIDLTAARLDRLLAGRA